ncbi:MAG: hypothetical protein JO214_12925 [Frankiaceae bacterium]|nr:hypothetical protein [Frankiaceae bacterium]
MALADLQEALIAEGYAASITGDFVTFPYVVPVGAHAGTTVQIGLQAPDFPINPPGGVHVSPRLQHPGDSAHHASTLGPAWIYWSRPYPDWPQSARSASDYLAHLRKLFSQFVATAA